MLHKLCAENNSGKSLKNKNEDLESIVEMKELQESVESVCLMLRNIYSISYAAYDIPWNSRTNRNIRTYQ